MLEISSHEVEQRLAFDNPWWSESGDLSIPYRGLPERSYLPPFQTLIENRSVRRAVILMGPRRVGKTVMLHQAIQKLLEKGTVGNSIMFLSLETPIYTGIGLEKFVRIFQKRFTHAAEAPLTIIFDEIQYLKDWEIHLKSLVDSFPSIRFIASGSAAAALRLKSRESGAGRFTEFLLPPLTFAEYLRFINKESEFVREIKGPAKTDYIVADIDAFNRHFIEYLNIGGYPEAVMNEAIRNESDRYIKSDIIDKVLLRDLPQLYGIRDIQELNKLFTVLAYNTGNEVSLDGLSQSSGVSKTTLSRYLEYLEAAFLIKRIYRIDQNAKHFQRATSFKVYLTNPTMRAALFGKLNDDDQSMGSLAETALFSQWFHDPERIENLYYARWPKGEIDMVSVDSKNQKPIWCVEVKWTDRPVTDKSLLDHIRIFRTKHPTMRTCVVTTRSITSKTTINEMSVSFIPTSLQVYIVGKNIVKGRHRKIDKQETINTEINDQ